MLPFAGLWRRTALFEPAEAAVPNDTDATATVLWVQSAGGTFIDVRAPLDKSFAGSASYDTATDLLTWVRRVDARPPGPPDVGRIVWLGPDAIDEFGVPPDDYRETWSRRPTRDSDSSDVAVELGGECTRGFAVVVRGVAGVALETDGAYAAIIAESAGRNEADGAQLWRVLASASRSREGTLASARGDAESREVEASGAPPLPPSRSLPDALRLVCPAVAEALRSCSCVRVTSGSVDAATALARELGLRPVT